MMRAVVQPGHQAEIEPAQDLDVEDVRARAAALVGDRRMEDAAALLAHGRRLFPDDVHLLLDQASLAEATGDQEGAIELLQAAIDRHPGTEAAYRRAGALCRKLDRVGEAEAVLLEGMCWVPSSADLVADYAGIAGDRQDWGQAARRYRLARERFPSQAWTHACLAAALRRARRLFEAEQALLEGHRRVPHDAHFLLEYAEIAADREDWAEAARRFDTARGRYPDAWWACKRIADVLRRDGRADEAEAVLVEAQQRHPGEAALPIDYAEVAYERRDWALARSRFEIVRDRFPTVWWSYKRIADALRAAGRADEAEAMVLDGQRIAPDAAPLFIDHAELAFERRDWALALSRFEIVRERFPGEWWLYKRIAEASREVGRLDEAEAVLLDGQRRCPGEADLFLDHAELAAAARDWPEALRRFEAVRDRFPGLWWPWRRIWQTLREMDRFDDAEHVILQGMELFPDEPALVFDHADLHQWAGRVEEAVERYRIVHQRFPDSFWGYFLLSCSLATALHLDEAESMFIETMRVFPGERGPLIELVNLTVLIPADRRQISIAALGERVDDEIERCGETEDLLLARAQLAQLVGDYPGYLQRLLHVARLFPNARYVGEKIVGAREILLGRGELVPDESGAAASPPGPDGAPQTPRELLGWFESLGGGGPAGITLYGCELGYVQRHVALEPLSLLRWTGVDLPNVTRLFANDFAGVGQLETCDLGTVDDRYDWRFVDLAYELRCDHTHLDRLTVPREEALQMMCQRTKFLARKLREDLEDGEKIFVYRYLGPAPDEADMLALAEAVNGYGRNMLFFVCRADERHEPFTVRLVHPGLMVGTIDWFAPDRFRYPVNLDGWTRLCGDAYRIWRGQTAG